jgi:hypothetical protein
MGCRLVSFACHYKFVIVAFGGPILEMEKNAIALQLAVLITSL